MTEINFFLDGRSRIKESESKELSTAWAGSEFWNWKKNWKIKFILRTYLILQNKQIITPILPVKTNRETCRKNKWKLMSGCQTQDMCKEVFTTMLSRRRIEQERWRVTSEKENENFLYLAHFYLRIHEMKKKSKEPLFL